MTKPLEKKVINDGDWVIIGIRCHKNGWDWQGTNEKKGLQTRLKATLEGVYQDIKIGRLRRRDRTGQFDDWLVEQFDRKQRRAA